MPKTLILFSQPAIIALTSMMAMRVQKSCGILQFCSEHISGRCCCVLDWLKNGLSGSRTMDFLYSVFPGGQTAVSPITKAHKRILNGVEGSIESFVDVVFSVVNGACPKTGVLRVPDVKTTSGEKIERTVFKESDYYISLVAEGKEDFVIFKSHDGFFQFYGVGNQFACEVWFNLDGRRAYAPINPDCANTERVKLVTPFGQYTPMEYGYYFSRIA
ncbi:MAG: hypothetical protein ACOCN3_15180 [Roseburia inulinivorans]